MDDTTKPGGTLLVVDDEAAIREVMCMALDAGGYDCIAACDGKEALEVVSEHPEICGVITDLHMPEMDGVTLIRHLREVRPELPVVVSSGSVAQQDQLVLTDLGVFDILPKPYTAKQLIQCVDGFVQAGHCVAAAV